MNTFSDILIWVIRLTEFEMLKTTEQKKKYIQETRSQNYQASLKLEGITTSGNLTQLSKAQILQKYKKYSQAEN